MKLTAFATAVSFIAIMSDDSVVYDLNLQTPPYKINLNGLTLNYEPFAVSGNTLEIYPSTRLDYNTPYYVKMTAGFCTDANGNFSPAITTSAWRFTTKATAPAADEDYLVAIDGSGDFCTFQGATDAVTDNDTNRTVIKIKNGSYRELIHIPNTKTNTTWLGVDKNTTSIDGYNRDGFNGGTDGRPMVRSEAYGLRIYNITLHNTAPDNSGQAAVIRNKSGLQCLIDNCKFLSYQDTLLIESQTYFRNSYIQGDTDFIWGYGVGYFDKCELHLMSTNSHITQPRTPNTNNGLFFVDCNLTGEPGITNCDYGRLFGEYPNSQNVYIDCTMPSGLIIPAGWNANGVTDANTFRL